ncbi:hypothetical protein SAMN04488502_1011208 [Dendrosporobacter quercicolus]|uniref:Uncharacterized protein n=1 Tax=Dendrosporobacter quercicolus TaxID=146817 RepID=A0A1G9P462_9FIRM|nr:hypothetical protein SAMN04488502_1011208 [Dendrosporobacter quercicolus]
MNGASLTTSVLSCPTNMADPVIMPPGCWYSESPSILYPYKTELIYAIQLMFSFVFYKRIITKAYPVRLASHTNR